MIPFSYREEDVPVRCGKCLYCKMERIQSEDYVYVCIVHGEILKGESIYNYTVNPTFGKCTLFEPN